MLQKIKVNNVTLILCGVPLEYGKQYRSQNYVMQIVDVVLVNNSAESLGWTAQILLMSFFSFLISFLVVFLAISFQAYLLLGDEEYLYIFNEAYKAAMQYLHNDPWYSSLLYDYISMQTSCIDMMWWFGMEKTVEKTCRNMI